MRKYRLYRFSYVIIPRTDIPIPNNKIILLKTRKPAVIIHIRQSPKRKIRFCHLLSFLGLLLKLCSLQSPTNILHQEGEIKSFNRFSNCFQTLHANLFSYRPLLH